MAKRLLAGAIVACVATLAVAIVLISFQDNTNNDSYELESFPLPKALQDAEVEADAESKAKHKLREERAAHEALAQYHKLQEKANIELSQESISAKSLVNGAAQELMAEKAARSARPAKYNEFGQRIKRVKKMRPGDRWAQEMKDASAAALDMINKSDHAESSNAKHWQKYAKSQLNKVHAENMKLAQDKKLQAKQIKQLILSGKLKPEDAVKKADAHKAQLAEKAAAKAATALLKKEKKTALELKKKEARDKRINKIAKADMPALEKHLKKEEDAVTAHDWKEKAHKAKEEAAERNKHWLKLVREARAKQKAEHAARRAAAAAEQAKIKKLENAQVSRAQQHIDNQISEIVSPASPAHHKANDDAQHRAVAAAKLKLMEKKNGVKVGP